jgi:hypothetical protein
MLGQDLHDQERRRDEINQPQGGHFRTTVVKVIASAASVAMAREGSLLRMRLVRHQHIEDYS